MDGFICTTCEELSYRGWGRTCNSCIAKQDQHREKIRAIEKASPCKHKWEDIDSYRKYLGTSGNLLTGLTRHYSKVFVQKCKSCNLLNQSEV